MSTRRRLHPRPFLVEALTALGLIAAPFVLPHLGFAPNTVNQILVWGLFGIGFDILFGYTGLLSFGQSAFYGTGGFIAAYLLTQDVISSVPLALLIGTVGAAVVGVAVGLLALRRTGIYFAMITVAIAEMFFFIENSPLSAWTGGENGLPGVPSPHIELFGLSWKVGTGWSMYWFLALFYFVGIVLALRIVRSPVGAILSAIRDNPVRAAALGHSVGRLQAGRLRHRRHLCRHRRRPAGRPAGLHAARRLHLRDLGPARHADGRSAASARCSGRCSAPPSGCS